MYHVSRKRNAFTLIEVLVVVAIIALLVAILLPSLKNARDQAKSLKCLAGMKQVGVAMSFYIADNKSNFIPPFRYPFREFRYKDGIRSYRDPYWFQYLTFKYLFNQTETTMCPTDMEAQKFGRTGFPELVGGSPRITYSYGMNDRMPTANPPTYRAMAVQGLLADSEWRYTPTRIGALKRGSDTIYLTETRQHNLLSGDSTRSEFRVDHGGRRDRITIMFADTHAEQREFYSVWFGDRNTGFSRLSTVTAPGKYKQLWYGSPTANTQVLY